MAIQIKVESKFKVGQNVIYNGQQTKVTHRKLTDMKNAFSVLLWEYYVEGYRNRVKEDELVAEDADHLHTNKVDFK